MKKLFKKTMLFALITALAVASLPFVSVFAAGTDDPQPPQGQITNEKLEKIWARQQQAYEKIGKGFDRSDEFVAKVKGLIDRAQSNGKDVSGVQAALDAFDAAVKQAHPLYESSKGIISSHQGFDTDGKVTDSEKAKETVRSMGEKLKEIKAAMNGTGKALREAIKAFRDANPRPTKSPTPTGG